jgi:S-adenosylmethionine:tRNA ribosyltransferase-isomerase
VLTSELDYDLPEDLIAQSPAEPRDASRLMVVDVGRNTIAHHKFRDLPQVLIPGDALVLNETRVLPARIRANKPTGGAVELLFLNVEQAGAEVARITLHVGVGTFMPVRTERLEDHTMHAEHYSVPKGAVRTEKGSGIIAAPSL